MLCRKILHVRDFVGPSCYNLQTNSPTVALVAVPAAVRPPELVCRLSSSRALNVAASVIPAVYWVSGYGFCNGPEGACLAAISCWPSLAFRVARSAAERSLQDFPALSSGVANSTDCKQQQDGVAFLDP